MYCIIFGSEWSGMWCRWWCAASSSMCPSSWRLSSSTLTGAWTHTGQIVHIKHCRCDTLIRTDDIFTFLFLFLVTQFPFFSESIISRRLFLTILTVSLKNAPNNRKTAMRPCRTDNVSLEPRLELVGFEMTSLKSDLNYLIYYTFITRLYYK